MLRLRQGCLMVGIRDRNMTLKVQICGCCDFVQPLEPALLLRRLAGDLEDPAALCQHGHWPPGDYLPRDGESHFVSWGIPLAWWPIGGYENISTDFFVNCVVIRKLQDCNQHPLEACWLHGLFLCLFLSCCPERSLYQMSLSNHNRTLLRWGHNPVDLIKPHFCS